MVIGLTGDVRRAWARAWAPALTNGTFGFHKEHDEDEDHDERNIP